MKNFVPYVSQEAGFYTLGIAEELRQKVLQACLGVSCATLMGMDGEQAKVFESQGMTATVPLADFDRNLTPEKRAEGVFRRVLLPGVLLELISSKFVLNEEAIKKPEDFSEIAILTLPKRTISVVRIMASAHETAEVENASPKKFEGRRLLPGHIAYRMLVEDINRRTTA